MSKEKQSKRPRILVEPCQGWWALPDKDKEWLRTQMEALAEQRRQEHLKETVMKCEICGADIVGDPFNLSAFSEDGAILNVCETCAGSQWITIDHDGIEVTLPRDDYIQADKERFDLAVGQAYSALEDLGWELTAIKMRPRTEPQRR